MRVVIEGLFQEVVDKLKFLDNGGAFQNKNVVLEFSADGKVTDFYRVTAEQIVGKKKKKIKHNWSCKVCEFPATGPLSLGAHYQKKPSHRP